MTVIAPGARILCRVIHDSSSVYAHSLLFLEAHLKQTTPDDPSLYQGQQAAMDVLDDQLWPAYQALMDTLVPQGRRMKAEG